MNILPIGIISLIIKGKIMKDTSLNVDLRKMSYEDFKEFMKGLATLYSESTFDFSVISLNKSLRNIAKKIEQPIYNLFTIYGAYEIADNQVVLAVFDIAFNFDDDESEENERPKVEVSFAEDTTRLRCPISVRSLLTQSDYVSRAEQAFPRIMEEMLLEREKERRKGKSKPEPITFTDNII